MNTHLLGLSGCCLTMISSDQQGFLFCRDQQGSFNINNSNIFKYLLCSYNVQAALCFIRIIKKVPDLAENFVNPVASLLKEKHHGVLLTAIQLCADLYIVSEEALGYFRKVY